MDGCGRGLKMGLAAVVALACLGWLPHAYAQQAECGKVKAFDLMFLVHYSEKSFQPMKDFLYSFINSIQPKPDIKIGLAFVLSQKGEFNMTNYKADLLSKITQLRMRPPRRVTINLKKFLRGALQYFQENAGGRPNLKVPQITVLLTDGLGTTSLQDSTFDLHKAGVTVFTVAVGISDTKNLSYVASYPYENTIITVDSAQQLTQARQVLLERMCSYLAQKYNTYWEMRKAVENSCSKVMKADVYFLIDGSGGVSKAQFNEMKLSVNRTVHYFPIQPHNVRVGVTQYSTGTNSEVNLEDYSTKRDLRCAVHLIEQQRLPTNIENGLEDMVKRFRRTKRPNTPQYLVAMMDGYKENVDDLKLASHLQALKESHVITFTIGEDSDVLQKVSTSPDNYFKISDFALLKDIELQLTQKICDSTSLYSSEADIVFLLDSSSSTSPSDYELMKEFLKTFVKSIVIGKDHIRVAVVQYSETVNKVFSLDIDFTQAQYQEAIERMQQMKGDTLTGHALQSVSSVFQTSPDRDRKVLVVITNGNSEDQVSQAATNLRKSWIDIYAITPPHAEYSQLEAITASSAKIFPLHEDLSTLVQTVKDKLQMECQNADIADIVFIVDVSLGVQPKDFEIIKNFLISIVNRFTIGPYNTQIGVTLYAADVREGFGLREYKTFSSLQSGIQVLDTSRVNRNGRNTLEAIQFSKNLLLRDGRKRLSIPQFLITIAYKDTTDFAQLDVVVEDVLASGIHTVAVGVDYANEQVLRTIGGSDSSSFFAKSFEELKYLSRRVTKDICNVPYCNTTLVDLVFLIDGSESIKDDEFKLEKDFMQSVVRSFDANDNVRVGLAQFSSNCVKEFSMRSFRSIAEFTKKLEAVNQLNSGTDLAEALSVSREFFTADQRRPNIKPHLVVLTDGDDRHHQEEKIARLAQLLRTVDDVSIVAVAVGEYINPMILNMIANSPSNIFRTSSHINLKEVVPKVVRAVCDSPECAPPPAPPTPLPPTLPPPPKDCLIDIAVGVDIAGESGERLLFYHGQLRAKLLASLKALSELRLSTCSPPTAVRFGFQVTNTDPPFITSFQPLTEEVVRELEARVIRETSLLDGRYLLSFMEKFRRESTPTHIKVVLIFTDGLDVSITELKAASTSLRQDGVRGLITVALEGMSKEAIQELHDIEFGPFGTGTCCRAQLVIGDTIAGELHSAFVSFTEEVCCRCCVCIGPPGPKGAPGASGMKGAVGQIGVQGHGGDDGPPGVTGVRGMDGLPGYKGCAGPRGAKGSRGFSGDQGEYGVNGWDGIQGKQGDVGAPGYKGVKGDHGNRGERGPPGPPGERGAKGLRGDLGDHGLSSTVAGPKGNQGHLGPDGDPGERGADGHIGDPGNKGRDGRRGPEGVKGNKGSIGAEGQQGEKGFRGLQGTRGPQGDKGQPGYMGRKGPQGPDGPQGPKGTIGSRGSPGAKGQPGGVGEKGDVGDMGFRGPPGRDGIEAHGPPGVEGRKGAPGNMGPVGPRGEPGEKGSRGEVGPKGGQGAWGLSGQRGLPGAAGEPGYNGRRGPKGVSGTAERSKCDLLDFVRENCACQGCHGCPVHPLDLVIAYDMSNEVLDFQLSNMRDLIVDIINGTHISESSCPTGARVAVASFSDRVKRVIHFSDYHSQKRLLQLVGERVVYQRGGGPRNLAEAMRYVARHMFKRSRGGQTVSRMAVFLTRMYMGRGDFARVRSTDENEAVYTAVMELYANGITPVIVTTVPPEPAITNAFSNFPGRYEIVSEYTTDEQILARLTDCFLCYDFCHPHLGCPAPKPTPVNLNADVLFLLDGSRDVSKADYKHARMFLRALVDRFGSASASPRPLLTGARLALVQQRGFTTRGEDPVKVEFDFQQYVAQQQAIQLQIEQSLRQTQGSSALGLALESVMANLFTKQAQPGSKRVIFFILGAEDDPRDQKKLREMALRAKCAGYILFTLALGSEVKESEIEILSSLPVSVHSCHLNGVGTPDVDYAVRFAESFFRLLPKMPTDDPDWKPTDNCQQIQFEDASQHGILADKAYEENMIAVKHNMDQDLSQHRLEQQQNDQPQLTTVKAQSESAPSPTSPDLKKCLPNGQRITPTQPPQAPDTTHPAHVPRSAEQRNDEMTVSVQGEPEAQESPLVAIPQITVSEAKLTPTTYSLRNVRVNSIGQQLLLPSARCLQKKDSGRTCSGSLQWYFNTQTKRCTVFWYGGCGGNENKFPTQRSCRQHCISQRIQ